MAGYFAHIYADLSTMDPVSDSLKANTLRRMSIKSSVSAAALLTALPLVACQRAADRRISEEEHPTAKERMMTTGLLLVLAVLSSSVAACSPQSDTRTAKVASLDAAFERDTLVVVTNDGNRLDFDVYLAMDFEQQRRGLMFVRDLPERTGMLFVYEEDAIHSMWMKNTYISLDIVFARSDGSVSSVIRDTEPQSLSSLQSIEPVAFVLELNAGVTRRYNIGNKSRLIWSPPAD